MTKQTETKTTKTKTMNNIHVPMIFASRDDGHALLIMTYDAVQDRLKKPHDWDHGRNDQEAAGDLRRPNMSLLKI